MLLYNYLVLLLPEITTVFYAFTVKNLMSLLQCFSIRVFDSSLDLATISKLLFEQFLRKLLI